jgi:crotonobetainyl-CoA:carnitine CoA-transferase CaiB-like acyl-CoA transferase
MPKITASAALSRFKVLDLSRVRAGPTCVRQLADWGADVIKIETPPGVDDKEGMGGPRLGPDFQNLHRNKRSLTLNLKSPEGVAIFKKLAASADVVVENYRPDVKFRLGIDYESLRPLNPRLVYASISGYGQEGPYRARAGFDQIAQGMGGLMSITGLPGQGPVRAGIAVADSSAGLYAALGILIALLEREQSGEGQWVQSSLLHSMVAMLDFQAARYLIKGEVPAQAGNDHPTSIPTGVFPTSDGYINIAASGQAIWERVAKVMEHPEWITDADFATGALRSKNRKRVNELLAGVTKTRPSAEWIELLNGAGIPAGPIYSVDQMFSDPQVRHLGIAGEIHHPELGDTRLVTQPVYLSRTPSSLATATPAQGEHSDEILRELGYADGDIADLRKRNVI